MTYFTRFTKYLHVASQSTVLHIDWIHSPSPMWDKQDPNLISPITFSLTQKILSLETTAFYTDNFHYIEPSTITRPKDLTLCYVAWSFRRYFLHLKYLSKGTVVRNPDVVPKYISWELSIISCSSCIIGRSTATSAAWIILLLVVHSTSLYRTWSTPGVLLDLHMCS